MNIQENCKVSLELCESNQENELITKHSEFGDYEVSALDLKLNKVLVRNHLSLCIYLDDQTSTEAFEL